MSQKREVPRLNKDNLTAWQGLMRLNLAFIGDSNLKYLDQEYISPPAPLSFSDIAERKTHNNMMIYLASAISYE